MSAWMETVEPHATAWRRLEIGARQRGLVHGMEALDHLRGNYGPADVASLLAAMVVAGVLRPIKVDPHGPHMHSVLAFRTAGPSAGGKLATTWTPWDAHCWTYETAPEIVRLAAGRISR